MSKKISSWVWDFFDPINESKSQCKLCDNVISKSGNTSNLASHIRNKHPQQHKKKLNDNQPKIKNFLVSKERKNHLDREFAILCGTKCLALNLVGSPEFKRFMSAAVPGYVTPSVLTLKEKYLFPMAQQVRQLISKQSNDKKFALTTDLWSNVRMESFLGVTCHYMDGAEKKNVALECAPFKGEHDNNNIRQSVSLNGL